MNTQPQSTGAFFVIDGTDGSGKATQTKRLVERLRLEGFDVETIAFPKYGDKSCAPAEKYLAGEYGSPEEVGPYRASIFFAIDRYDASFQIRSWLEEGKIVVADRYVSGNMGHQAAKISDTDERNRYLHWLEELEYGHFNLPRPTSTILLRVPAETAQQLAFQGAKEKTKVSGDILEADLKHLEAAEKTYLYIAKQFPGFSLIDCAPDGSLRSIEDIHQDIWSTVLPHIGTPVPHINTQEHATV